MAYSFFAFLSRCLCPHVCSAQADFCHPLLPSSLGIRKFPSPLLLWTSSSRFLTPVLLLLFLPKAKGGGGRVHTIPSPPLFSYTYTYIMHTLLARTSSLFPFSFLSSSISSLVWQMGEFPVPLFRSCDQSWQSTNEISTTALQSFCLVCLRNFGLK